jgi:uncharacterized protein YceK
VAFVVSYAVVTEEVAGCSDVVPLDAAEAGSGGVANRGAKAEAARSWEERGWEPDALVARP